MLANDNLFRFPRVGGPGDSWRRLPNRKPENFDPERRVEIARICLLRAELPDLPSSVEVFESLLRTTVLMDCLLAHGLCTTKEHHGKLSRNLLGRERADAITKLYKHWYSKETRGTGYGVGFESFGPDLAHPKLYRFPRAKE